MIWQAGENDEFLITSNGFEIFEGVSEVSRISGFMSSFQFPYYTFYIISPKLVLILCHNSFRKEVETNYPNYLNYFGRCSLFENVLHPSPVLKYVFVDTSRKLSNKHDTLFDKLVLAKDLERQPNDEFTFTFVKINSITVHLVNSMFLNKANEDLVLTFLSYLYLYKTIVKYHKDKDVCVQQDFSGLKKKLFMMLNKTHEKDLDFRKNIPASRTFSWNVRQKGL